jgi:hypothetical protein
MGTSSNESSKDIKEDYDAWQREYRASTPSEGRLNIALLLLIYRVSMACLKLLEKKESMKRRN